MKYLENVGYWENLLLKKVSSYLYTLGNDIYTGKNSSTNIFLFRVNNSSIRKRCKICLKLTIMSIRRRSADFIDNFEYISYIFTSFLVFLLLAFFEQLNVCWVLLYQFISVKITSCCKYKQTYKTLSEMVAHKKGLCSKIVVPQKIFFLVVYCV